MKKYHDADKIKIEHVGYHLYNGSFCRPTICFLLLEYPAIIVHFSLHS